MWISMKSKKHLHTTVCHGHGIISRGIAGDLAVVGTSGGGKNVARVDKVGAGGVSSTVGPVKDPDIFYSDVSFWCKVWVETKHSWIKFNLFGFLLLT